MSPWPPFNIVDGTEQRDRVAHALEPGYFRPDERRFDELLALGIDFARTLPFHDLTNERKGTWGDLFSVNEIAVMALILSKDTKQLEAGFLECMENGVNEGLRYVYAIARDLNFWLVALGHADSTAAKELSERIEVLVRERIVPVLCKLPAMVDLLLGKSPLSEGADFGSFHSAWDINRIVEEANRERDEAMRDWQGLPLRNDTLKIFGAFLNVVAHLQSLVRPYLRDSLESRGHEPALALFVVFVALLKRTRYRLNRFSQRHLDFYYRDVLKEQERKHKPDHLFFALDPVEGGKEIKIPVGTELVTKAHDGSKEIVFSSDEAVSVIDAKVDALYALRFQRDCFISPENELGYVTRIKSVELDSSSQDVEGSSSAAAPSAWSLFGASPRLPGDRGAQSAAIGFLVSSPVLLLREGQRTIEVQVELEDHGESSQLWNELLRQQEDTGVGDKERLVRVFVPCLSTAGDLLGDSDYTDNKQEATRLAECLDPKKVAIAFAHSRKKGRNFVYDLFLEAMVRQRTKTDADFYRALGRIFKRNLLAGGACLDDAGTCENGLVDDLDLKTLIDEKVVALRDRDAREAIAGLFARGREEIFQTLLADVFEISLTTPSGWHQVDRYAIGPLEESGKGARRGLRFRFNLDPDVDPVVPYSAEVHGGRWGGESPLIRFKINEEAHFCVYSLLNASRLSGVAIDVRVRGLRDLRLYNNLGRIDASKPFQPFGPVPTLSSYLALGSHEMAQKQLTELTLNLEWAELPTCFGGFSAHYADYGRKYEKGNFEVQLSVLRDGIWQPQDERQRSTAVLFEPTGPTGKLQSSKTIELDLLDAYRPAPRQIAEDQFDLQLGARNGFFRLHLSGPEGAFGHAEYPMLLTKALSENVRSKVFGKVPNPPYTPVLSQIEVDYGARARIAIDATGSEERADRGQKIFHLHPFGYEEFVPVSGAAAYTLLPKYDTDGNLFIGISGRNLRATSLVFQLTDQSNQQTLRERPDLIWHYLSNQGWRRLPASSLISDTTSGLLTSGVVRLVLPEDLDTQSTLMPPGKSWLRIGANGDLDLFPRLIAVRANGIHTTRRINTAGGETFSRQLPPGCKWRTAVSIPGLGAITQLGGSFGGEPTETRRRFVTRVSERLCHKDRPVTAWDYERLILQRFPTLFKVKCFAGLRATDVRPSPGHILIVVVPHVVGGEAREYQRPMVDVLELRKIRRFVQEVSSPSVAVEIRNPLYEQIQVRCSAKFRDDTNSEYYIRRLNQDVSAFLSPWVPIGFPARFGWIVRSEQIEGFIRDLDYVEFVTDFSMLHIAEDDPDTYTLVDTVRHIPSAESVAGQNETASPRFSRSHQVQWRYPWSLAVPMARHFIQAIRVAAPIKPEPTGIGELEIGRTLIISGSQQP